LFLRSANLLQPVVFDQLWWTVALLALIRWCRSGDPRTWLAFGAACGAGLLTKFSILVFGLATLLALLTTPARRALAGPWPWIAAVIALLLGSPSILGQIRLGFPIFDQMGDLARAQLSRVGPGEFLVGQALFGPAPFLLGGIGLAGLLGAHAFRRERVVGWICLWALVLLVAMRGKPYYAGPLYPTLIATGAVLLDGLAQTRRTTVVRWSAVGVVALWGGVMLPLGLPILPPERMEQYLAVLRLDRARTTNVGDVERLPQDYADMVGWRGLVAAVAEVYHGLPVAERERAAILASNYGEAGAVDFHGPRLGLPRAVAYVGTYWFFGPGPRPGDPTVLVGFPREDVEDGFATLDSAGSWTHPFMVAEQRDLTLFVGRGPRETLQQIWPRLEGEQ
jgi:hypothetical protein